MMYMFEDNRYDSLYDVIMENGLDDKIEFDNWLNENYSATELLALWDRDKRWYCNIQDLVNEELYFDFLNEMSTDKDFLYEFEITTVDDEEDINE